VLVSNRQAGEGRVVSPDAPTRVICRRLILLLLVLESIGRDHSPGRWVHFIDLYDWVVRAEHHTLAAWISFYIVIRAEDVSFAFLSGSSIFTFFCASRACCVAKLSRDGGGGH